MKINLNTDNIEVRQELIKEFLLKLYDNKSQENINIASSLLDLNFNKMLSKNQLKQALSKINIDTMDLIDSRTHKRETIHFVNVKTIKLDRDRILIKYKTNRYSIINLY